MLQPSPGKWLESKRDVEIGKLEWEVIEAAIRWRGDNRNFSEETFELAAAVDALLDSRAAAENRRRPGYYAKDM